GRSFQPQKAHAVPGLLAPRLSISNAFFAERVVAEAGGEDGHAMAAPHQLPAEIVAARRLAVGSVGVVIENPNIHECPWSGTGINFAWMVGATVRFGRAQVPAPRREAATHPRRRPCNLRFHPAPGRTGFPQKPEERATGRRNPIAGERD